MTTDRDLYCSNGLHFAVAYGGNGAARDALRDRVTAALTAAGFTPTKPVPATQPALRVIMGGGGKQ